MRRLADMIARTEDRKCSLAEFAAEVEAEISHWRVSSASSNAATRQALLD